jgi:hypothetical protein
LKGGEWNAVMSFDETTLSSQYPALSRSRAGAALSPYSSGKSHPGAMTMSHRNSGNEKINRIVETANRLAAQVGGTFEENRDKRRDYEHRETRSAA